MQWGGRRSERCPGCQRMMPVISSGKFIKHRLKHGLPEPCPNSGGPSGHRDMRQIDKVERVVLIKHAVVDRQG